MMRFFTQLPAFLLAVVNFLKNSVTTFWGSLSAFHASMVLFFNRVFVGQLTSNWFLLLTLLGPLVWKIIALAGFAAVSYVGVSVIADRLVSFMQSKTSVLPAPIFAIMGIMQLDVGFKMIVSAGLVKFTLMGWDKLTQTATRMRFIGFPSQSQ